MFHRLNIASLRKAASFVFSKPHFRDVRWAGVFGSFAVGSQTKSSLVDPDVIVILMPQCEKINSHPLSLEDELFRVWGRKPRIKYIKNGGIRDLYSVKALLCSRALAGSNQDHEVVRLRNEARNILDFGLARFTAVLHLHKVQWTRSLVEGITIAAFLHLLTIIN
jgi:predicted nucleotidyltransferase